MTPSKQTRERLLDAAETLFAEHGIAGASMRSITTMAGSNLASVSYHFGSKDGLLKTLLEDRMNPINDRRLALLAEGEANGTLTVESLVHGLIMPAVDPEHRPSDSFLQLMTHIHHSTDPTCVQVMSEVFGPVSAAFGAALAKQLPDIPLPLLFQRIQFVIGAMIHSLFSMCAANCPVADTFGGQDALTLAPEVYVDQFVAFAAAGLRA